jgi:hypothetical protein
MNEKLPQEELLAKLQNAAKQVTVGSTYKHYKGGLYIVKGLGIEESTDEISVIYEACYGERLTFIRALTSWLEIVAAQGVTIPRFAETNTKL